ncbi:hypothetical protein AHiyo6_36430 [Arthrobacter sp. Hiyo6]|nr:hypothetical protein AHiyo6_36430 [Arthrobacter sp. Hiyo6]
MRTFSRPVWLVILVFGSCFGALGSVEASSLSARLDRGAVDDHTGGG